MHKPVMLDEVLRFAVEARPRTLLDGTFGRGGHTRALMAALPALRVTALDQDEAAIAHAHSAFAAEIGSGRLVVKHFNFHDIANVQGRPGAGFDLILLDLGVSSPQLDEPARGFSFYHDGPLDMRMNQSTGETAADVLNNWPEVQLLQLFQKYGEISRPHRVVRAIVNDRKIKAYTGTLQIAGLIERVEGWHKKGHHPATRYFLALRMVVNNELTGLEACLPDMRAALSAHGRLIVITFHSLEDRIIKYDFREAPGGFPLTKKVVVPSREEEKENPRARSAKLRVFQQGERDYEPREIE